VEPHLEAESQRRPSRSTSKILLAVCVCGLHPVLRGASSGIRLFGHVKRNGPSAGGLNALRVHTIAHGPHRFVAEGRGLHLRFGEERTGRGGFSCASSCPGGSVIALRRRCSHGFAGALRQAEGRPAKGRTRSRYPASVCRRSFARSVSRDFGSMLGWRSAPRRVVRTKTNAACAASPEEC